MKPQPRPRPSPDEDRTTRLPGTWLMRLCPPPVCTPDQYEHVVLPAIADWQVEWQQAAGRIDRARAYLTGLAGVWRVVGLCLVWRVSLGAFAFVTLDRQAWKDARHAVLVIIGLLVVLALVQPRFLPNRSTTLSMQLLLWLGSLLRAYDGYGIDATVRLLVRRAAIVAVAFAVGALVALGWICPLLARPGGPFATFALQAAQMEPVRHLTLSDLWQLRTHLQAQGWPQLLPPITRELHERILVALAVFGVSCMIAAVDRGRRAYLFRGYAFLICVTTTLTMALLTMWLVSSQMALAVSALVISAADAIAFGVAAWIFARAVNTGELEPLPDEELRRRLAATSSKPVGRILHLD